MTSHSFVMFLSPKSCIFIRKTEEPFPESWNMAGPVSFRSECYKCGLFNFNWRTFSHQMKIKKMAENTFFLYLAVVEVKHLCTCARHEAVRRVAPPTTRKPQVECDRQKIRPNTLKVSFFVCFWRAPPSHMYSMDCFPDAHMKKNPWTCETLDVTGWFPPKNKNNSKQENLGRSNS